MAAARSGREISPRGSPAASRAARAAVESASEHEAAIRDVAAGVAAPGPGRVRRSGSRSKRRRRGLRRLRFLSRDGQVLYELTRRLAPLLGAGLDLEYVYSSRLTWSLAATRPGPAGRGAVAVQQLRQVQRRRTCAPGSACRSRSSGRPCSPAACPWTPMRAPTSLPRPALCGGSWTRRRSPSAVGARIAAMRRLVLDYAAQHELAEADTGLVDIGWTGRMAGSLIECVRGGRHEPAARPVLGARAAARDRVDRSRTSRLLHLQHRDRARAAAGGYRTPRSSWRPSAWATTASCPATATDAAGTVRACAAVASERCGRSVGTSAVQVDAVRVRRSA